MTLLTFVQSLQHFYKKKRYSQVHLYTAEMTNQHSTRPVDDAIRWIDSVIIDGVRKNGLFMHPNSSVDFQYTHTEDVKGTLSLSPALLPDIWEKNTDGVLFSVEITINNSLTQKHSIHINPRTLKKHRQWNTLSFTIAAEPGDNVSIQLRTSLPEGASGDNAWAVWGSPEILYPLSFIEILKRIQRHSLQHGVWGLIKKMITDVSAPETFDSYEQWIIKNETVDQNEIKEAIERLQYTPGISILTPVYNADPRWLNQCIESVKNQSYPHWELCLVDDGSTNADTLQTLKTIANTDPRIKVEFSKENQGIAATTNKALALASGEFIGLLDNDDELSFNALYEVVSALQERQNIDMLYSDEDKMEIDGKRTEPFFKPDWSPEYFLSSMYTSHFGVYRKSIAEKIQGFRSAYDKAQDYDFVLRFIEQIPPENIHHIAKILYHWRKIPGSTAVAASEKDMSDQPAIRAVRDFLKRTNKNADVLFDPTTGYHRVRYAIQDTPLVSILLPTNGQYVTNANGESVNLLMQCITSVEEKTTYNSYEFVIGYNDTLDEKILQELEKRKEKNPNRYTLIHYKYEEPFNFSHKMNTIAQHANGEYYLILNDDIEVISPDWMSALLEYAQQPEIGVVGAKLYFPNGTIQHAGVVMGIGGGASHVWSGQPGSHPGYFASTKIVRNYSVVTGACFMTKKKLFTELHGLDEAFRIDYNDVDYCLRVRELGYRVVWTPYAELTHHESVTLGSRAGQSDRPEEHLLRERWEKVIAHDPSYNPNLTLTDTNYQLKLS